MERFLCVAFDLDDTLYKERQYVVSGRKAVADAMSKLSGIGSAELFELMQSSDDAFDALLDRLSTTSAKDVTIDLILDIYRSHKPELTLSAETETLLSDLKSAGIALGVITDGRHDTQWNKIMALGLDRYIEKNNIIVSGDVGADKRTSVPFEILQSSVGASHYIYIGDNPSKDFHYPNLMGWMTVMLKDTEGVNVHKLRPEDFGTEYRARIEIENINDIKKYINTL